MGPWEITLTTFFISSTQAHSTERATHDTSQSSLHQHHPTSPASPYPLPELRKKCVAKSETFCSKSIACCNLFPPLRVKKMYEVWGIGPYSGSSACNEFVHPPASLMKPRRIGSPRLGDCLQRIHTPPCNIDEVEGEKYVSGWTLWCEL